MTTYVFANPLADTPAEARNAGDVIAERLREHSCQPPASESHWCAGCGNACQVTCAHCGEPLLTVASPGGSCPDCPA